MLWLCRGRSDKMSTSKRIAVYGINISTVITSFIPRLLNPSYFRPKECFEPIMYDKRMNGSRSSCIKAVGKGKAVTRLWQIIKLLFLHSEWRWKNFQKLWNLGWSRRFMQKNRKSLHWHGMLSMQHRLLQCSESLIQQLQVYCFHHISRHYFLHLIRAVWSCYSLITFCFCVKKVNKKIVKSPYIFHDLCFLIKLTKTFYVVV